MTASYNSSFEMQTPTSHACTISRLQLWTLLFHLTLRGSCRFKVGNTACVNINCVPSGHGMAQPQVAEARQPKNMNSIEDGVKRLRPFEW
jgi:hypothetical protein